MQTTAASPAASPSFLIEKILPTRTIHLISGPSGVGKTTYLLQLLNDWTAGEDILERKSFPVPFCYMSCARGRDEAWGIAEQCEFANLRSDAIVTLPRDRSMPEDVSLEAALKLARHRVSGLKLLVLDSIGALCRGRVTEYNTVADFMRKVHDVCTHENLTIIGLGPHSKTDAEGSPRSRFLGSVAWGEYASTMIVLEGQQGSLDRTVHISGVRFAQETYTYQLDPVGKFVLTTDDSAALGALDMKLGALEPGGEFETSGALQWGQELGTGRATVERWLKRRVEDGVIERVRRGAYKLKFSA